MRAKILDVDGSRLTLLQWMLKYWDVDDSTITKQQADQWTSQTGIEIPPELIRC